MSFADECTRVYTRSGTVAHLMTPFATRGVLCHVMPEWPAGYLGTGSQREYEMAASLRLCKWCQRRAQGEDEYRTEACQWNPCTRVTCPTHGQQRAAG